MSHGDTIIECYDCEGRGQQGDIDTDCPTCDGHGLLLAIGEVSE